jgi:hypothetical protein
MAMSFTTTVRFTAGVLILSSRHVLSYFAAKPDFFPVSTEGGCLSPRAVELKIVRFQLCTPKIVGV